MKAAHVIGGVLGGCALLAIVAGVALVLGLRWAISEPEGVEVVVEAPLEVARGERFRVLAKARNVGDEPRRLVDVDVADAYLEGIVVESTTPPFRDAMAVPIDDTMSYSFDLEMAPGGEASVAFSMFAAHVGDFSGDIDFCIDSETRCLSYPVRTLVREAP